MIMIAFIKQKHINYHDFHDCQPAAKPNTNQILSIEKDTPGFVKKYLIGKERQEI